MTTLVEVTCTEDPNKAFFTRCRLPSGQFRSPSQFPQTRRCLYAYHVRISLAASPSFVKVARQKRRKARSYRFGSLISAHCTNPERVASRAPLDYVCCYSPLPVMLPGWLCFCSLAKFCRSAVALDHCTLACCPATTCTALQRAWVGCWSDRASGQRPARQSSAGCGGRPAFRPPGSNHSATHVAS